MYLRQIRD
jgi:hypothetical protein